MKIKVTVAAAAVGLISLAMAQSSVPMVGGSPMYPSKTIVENASAASNLITLVTAVKAAGLVDTLQGPGPGGTITAMLGCISVS
jgi:uncharacterized surface protein with fasciclin (FAS1) repeats